jgi:hypothetical protein
MSKLKKPVKNHGVKWKEWLTTDLTLFLIRIIPTSINARTKNGRGSTETVLAAEGTVIRGLELSSALQLIFVCEIYRYALAVIVTLTFTSLCVSIVEERTWNVLAVRNGVTELVLRETLLGFGALEGSRGTVALVLLAILLIWAIVTLLDPVTDLGPWDTLYSASKGYVCSTSSTLEGLGRTLHVLVQNTKFIRTICAVRLSCGFMMKSDN